MAYDDNVILFLPRGAITAAELDEFAKPNTMSLRALMDAIEDFGFTNRAGPLTGRTEWLELWRRLSLPPSFSPKAVG
jgi:hypothetical protein